VREDESADSEDAELLCVKKTANDAAAAAADDDDDDDRRTCQC